MKCVIGLLLIILPIASHGMNYSVGDILNVVAINGLTVRSMPSVKGDNLAILKTQEKIIVKDTSNFHQQADTIFGFNGHWILIQTKDSLRGYVFDAFLSTLPIAKSIVESDEKLPKNYFSYSGLLPGLLKDYAMKNFTKSSCAFEYSNRIDGESSHEMTVLKFKEGAVLMEHTYWEGTATELSLKNVRLSEIYYLVKQFFKDSNKDLLEINDVHLRNPKSYRDRRSCVGELKGDGCGVEVFKGSENAYSIKFNFPCC